MTYLRINGYFLSKIQYCKDMPKVSNPSQFGALYMHNNDDKYPTRPGFQSGISRLQAPVDTNEPSGLALGLRK